MKNGHQGVLCVCAGCVCVTCAEFDFAFLYYTLHSTLAVLHVLQVASSLGILAHIIVPYVSGYLRHLGTHTKSAP